jgi:chitinase
MLRFGVSLSAPSEQTVTVDYATAAAGAGKGYARPGRDYAAAKLSCIRGACSRPSEARGSLTFAPGQTSKSIPVAILGDGAAEGEEYFVVDLSSPRRGTLADGQATGLIGDDDAP